MTSLAEIILESSYAWGHDLLWKLLNQSATLVVKLQCWAGDRCSVSCYDGHAEVKPLDSPAAPVTTSQTMTERIQTILSYTTGPRVLDVGCAGDDFEVDPSRWLHGQLEQRFEHVEGIDIDSAKVERLRSLGYRSVHVMHAETFVLPGEFDTIVAGELIEHLSNPGLFLTQARKHLSARGRIVITTPYPFSLLYGLYGFLRYPRTCSNPEHTCWFCPETLQELIRRSDLRILHWDLVMDYNPTERSRPYRLLRSILKLLGFMIPGRLKGNTMILIATRLKEQRE